jgi:hypothetical protein
MNNLPEDRVRESTKTTKSTPSNVIPDQLNITIRTSIPGYQKIEYKPSMTIKDSDSKGVQFDPLIKLDKSKISKIPDEYRVKQFFNKGLFYSLLNYNGGTPARNLIYATRAGYVNNNIKVTLDTIFPLNSVIYIGKNPYVIADVQWSSGDWKLDVKHKKAEIDLSKITNPLLYNNLVREELIIGEQQLDELPQSVTVGDNYNGPPIARGPPVAPAAVAPSTQQSEASALPPSIPPALPPSAPPALPPSIPPALPPSAPPALPPSAPPALPPSVPPALPPSVPPPALPPIPPTDEEQQVELPPRVPPRNALLLNNDEIEQRFEDINPREQEILDNYISGLNFNIPRRNSVGYRTRQQFISFFTESKFTYVVNTIYKNLADNNTERDNAERTDRETDIQNRIKYFYRLVTQPQNQNTGKGRTLGVMYENLCKQCILLNPLPDIENISDQKQNGNSFFSAVSQGINIYNYENPATKITFRNLYGRTQLFTPDLLRDIVWTYYTNLTPRKKEGVIAIGSFNANNLNRIFRESVSVENVSDEMYVAVLNEIYTKNNNFFVHNPQRRPVLVDDEENPFRVLMPNEIERYIKSEYYRGDKFAIKAICSLLRIIIIPIEKYRGIDNEIKYKTIVNYTDEQTLNCSNKIIFLYKESFLYHLIVFIYKSQVNIQVNQAQKRYTVKNTYFTIFDTTSQFPPPFHMLLLLYGSSYIKLNNEKIRRNFVYERLMNYVNGSVNTIIFENNDRFIRIFNDIFNMLPPEPSVKYYIENYLAVDEEDEEGDNENNEMVTRGGNLPYGYQGNITKTPENRDNSKLAYEIVIDMELQPGTSLTPQQINESKCNSKYNAIRKAFAEFTGRPYVIPPVYKSTQTKKNVGGKPNRNTRRKH